ncbi:hypothetical protein Tco_1469935 [Tanacetum coccineum]
MQGTELSKQEIDSRLSNEFDRFTFMAGESLESVYERFSRLMNEMEQNQVLPYKTAINTKRNEVNVNASRAKRASIIHDTLALVANSYGSPSSSRQSSTYYVIHPTSKNDFDDYNQGDVTSDGQTNDLTTAMVLLARAITQHYPTPTNSRLRTSSNTQNQAYVQDGRFNIQNKNVGYVGNGGRNTGRIVGNQEKIIRNTYGQRITRNDANVQRTSRTAANSSNTSTMSMLLSKKDKAGINLDEEENNFLPSDAPEEEELEELDATCILMARIQSAVNDSDPYLVFVNEVHKSQSCFMNEIFFNREDDPTEGSRRQYADRDAISINEPRGTYTDADVDEVKENNKRLRKELAMLRTVVKSDDQMSQLLTQLELQHEVYGGSGSGRGGDNEPDADEDAKGDDES